MRSRRRVRSNKPPFFGDFKEVVKVLRREIPPAFPIRVIRTRLKEDAGDCLLKDGRFIIRIDTRLGQDAAVLILLHEWAHALAWDAPGWLPGEEDHHPAWGMAYSRVYEVWLDNV